MERALKHYPIAEVSGHFHDTYGQAIGNVYASLEVGISTFDASVAGPRRLPVREGRDRQRRHGRRAVPARRPRHRHRRLARRRRRRGGVHLGRARQEAGVAVGQCLARQARRGVMRGWTRSMMSLELPGRCAMTEASITGRPSASSASARWAQAWPDRCDAPAPTCTSATCAPASPPASREQGGTADGDARPALAAAMRRRRLGRRQRGADRGGAVRRGGRRRAAAMRPGSVFVMCSTVDPNVSIGFEAPARGDGPALRRRADLRRRGQGRIGRDDGDGRGASRRRGASAEPLLRRDGRPRSTGSATAPATAAR